MTSFSDVPDELKIAGIRFWLASEALEAEERRSEPWDGDSVRQDGERPDPDWAATSLFMLARVQLDQLVEILGGEFSIQAAAFSGSEVSRRLEGQFDELDEETDDDLLFMVTAIGEAVDLWRALHAEGVKPVRHGFAVDGSITLSTGPNLPELGVLGLRGGDFGELETSPTEVLWWASECTRDIAHLAAVRRDREQQGQPAGQEAAHEADPIPLDTAEDQARRLQVLEQRAKTHFSIWPPGSEDAFADWAIACLRRAGLVVPGDSSAEARSAAYLMSLWALYLELNAYSEQGSVGDWRYGVAAWVGNGITEDHLRTLNSVDKLDWELDAPEMEAPLTEMCVFLVESHHRDVSDALLKELGDSLAFAYLWAARFEDVDYPLSPELVHQIVNDESVLFDDPQNKFPAFNWVQSGRCQAV